jgi:multiple sugar transport system permease protein
MLDTRKDSAMSIFAELSRGRRSRFSARLSPLVRREARWGLLFLSPWIVGFLAFTLLPILASLGLTFTNYTLTQSEPPQFVGLANYRTLIADPQVWASLLVTIKYGAIALPVGMILPLAIALLMNNQYLVGKSIFRTLFYFPFIIPFVAAVFIWKAMINPEFGWINYWLSGLGVQNPPRWINDPNWVYPGYVIIGLWGIGNAMVINLAALQSVPTELYDSAKIDGAGAWSRLIHITLPMISPVLFYLLILNIVGLFQYFLVPLVVNNGTGEPGGATLFYNLVLYKTFFTYQNMAYGSTMAWLLFVIILLVTLVLFRTANRWVYYAGEVR